MRPEERDVIGYTTTGNFSLSRGKGHALASVTLAGFVELLRRAGEGGDEGRHMALVKVRNRDGVICRLAQLELV